MTLNDPTNATHALHPLSSLLDPERSADRIPDTDYLLVSSRNGKTYLDLNPGQYRTRIVRFPGGYLIKRHRHTAGPIFKLLLYGCIRYETNEILHTGVLAVVRADIFYKGEVLEDSALLLIEPVGCQSCEGPSSLDQRESSKA